MTGKKRIFCPETDLAKNKFLIKLFGFFFHTMAM